MPPRSPRHLHFGEAVKAIREERGLTQVVVAKRMNPPVPASFLSDIERGIRNVSFETQLSLAAALKTKLSEIMARAGL